MIDNPNVINKLISNGAIIFHSEYGKKVVAETWTVRLNKQVKKTADYKDYLTYNIATGRDGNLVDADLDCWSARVLADYFYHQLNLSLVEQVQKDHTEFIK